jgi:hypothetical protein
MAVPYPDFNAMVDYAMDGAFTTFNANEAKKLLISEAYSSFPEWRGLSVNEALRRYVKYVWDNGHPSE